MLGAFPIGPVSGDDVLPLDPVEAMRSGKALRVPLIVGTNAEEGRLFTRFLPAAADDRADGRSVAC